MYGPAVRRKAECRAGERESCINVSGLLSGADTPGQHGYPRASEAD
jgi:hypothetical protein